MTPTNDHHNPNYEPQTDCMINGMDYNDHLFEESLKKREEKQETHGVLQIGKRLGPPEGITPKLGDKVVYEVVYDDGTISTITTWVSEFDLLVARDIKP